MIGLVVLLLFIITGCSEQEISKEKDSAEIKQEINEEQTLKQEIKETNSSKSDESEVNVTDLGDKEEDMQWGNEWIRNIQNAGGTLRVATIGEDTLEVIIESLSGANIASAEGVATYNGNKASFVDTMSQSGCTFDLTLYKDFIEISNQSSECSQLGGLGTTFEGKYESQELVSTTLKPTLESKGVLDPVSDGMVQDLVGSEEDYDKLVENFQMFPSLDTTSEKYGVPITEAHVYEGAVRGLYTLNEGIIVFEHSHHGYIYIANIIDGGVVRLYTNDQSFESKTYMEGDITHPIIDKWRERFNDYPVEYYFTPIYL